MKDKTELINILKAELTLLSQDIIKDIHKKDIKDLYKSSRKLYEKTNVLYYLSKLSEEEELDQVFEKVISEDKRKEVAQSNFISKEEELKDTKKDRIQPTEEKKGSTGSIYKSVSNMKFIPKSETTEDKNLATGKSKKMNIGLNDKIAFIRHLFNNDSTIYNKVIEELNKANTYEDALSYLNREVKPQFNDWKDKDEYEFRLLQLLELKFN